MSGCFYGEDGLLKMSWRDGVRQRPWQRYRFEAGQNFVDGGGAYFECETDTAVTQLLSIFELEDFKTRFHRAPGSFHSGD